MLNEIVKKYMQDNTKTLETILNKFAPLFKQIDNIKKSIIKLNVENREGTKEILTKLTGYYMEVVDVHSKLESLTKNKRHAYYYYKKIKLAEEDEKFVSKAVEEESELYISDERRTRDIFAGKVEACIEGIRTCRTLIQDAIVKKVTEEEK